MDYTNLFAGVNGKKSKVGIIGATRGYGYTLLAQILHVDLMELRAVCSRHPEECLAVLKEIGYDENKIVVCKDEEEIQKVPEDAIIIVADYRMWCDRYCRVYRKHNSKLRCGSDSTQ